jgi:RNA polymerase subunit RPABC4/transcription elongation factor Spt4
MKCPKCGYILPEDSEFCQYCGEKLIILSKTNSNPEMPEASREIRKVLQDNSTRENGPTVDNTKKRICKLCGGLIDPNTKKCTSCGQQYFRFSKKVYPIAIFIVMIIALAGLNICQYISYNHTIATLENKVAYYDDFCDFLSSDNIGYAADNFNADKSVILVSKSDTSMKITLTAYWSNGGTVSTSSSSSSADVVFDDDSWDETTTLTIEPYTEGISIITFSNDVDSDTFSILIIVTD